MNIKISGNRIRIMLRKVEHFTSLSITLLLLAGCGSITQKQIMGGSAITRQFDNKKEELVREEQRRIFQILVPVEFGSDEKQRRLAGSKAKAIYERIKREVKNARDINEAFIKAAEELSLQDTAGRCWGDLGWVSQGKYPENFDREVFLMRQEGEMLLFETEQGFHIVRLMNIRRSNKYSSENTYAIAGDKNEVNISSLSAGEKNNNENKIVTAPSGMVYVKGGEFWMGSTEKEIDERLEYANKYLGPYLGSCRRQWYEDEILKKVKLKSFYIDKNEVTIGEYREFLQSSGYLPVPEWIKNVPNGSDPYPAVQLSWYDAKAYAFWKGKRLPTAEEWEFAARGTERRRFPWGNELPDGTRANYCDVNSSRPWKDKEHDDGYAMSAPVGSYARGSTPEGINDLGGNVREWTGSLEPGSTRAVVKGGSYDNCIDDLTSSDYRTNEADLKNSAIGFRCVKDTDE